MPEEVDLGPGLTEHIDKVRSFEIENLSVPDFYIGNWPKNIGELTVRVRKVGFFFTIERTTNTLFRLRRYFCTGLSGFLFTIDINGYIGIKTFFGRNNSFYSQNYGGLQWVVENKGTCLLLFNHLREKALTKIVRKVEKDTRYNAEAVEAIKKALEPFLPQLVADKLSE